MLWWRFCFPVLSHQVLLRLISERLHLPAYVLQPEGYYELKRGASWICLYVPFAIFASLSHHLRVSPDLKTVSHSAFNTLCTTVHFDNTEWSLNCSLHFTHQTAVRCIPSHRVFLTMTVSFATTTCRRRFLNNSAPLTIMPGSTFCVLFVVDSCVCKLPIPALSDRLSVFILTTWAHLILGAGFLSCFLYALCAMLRQRCSVTLTFLEVKCFYRVTHATKISIALSTYQSGYWCSSYSRFSVSCWYWIPCLNDHGLCVLSFCLRYGLGYELELGILIGVMFALGDPGDFCEQMADVVHNSQVFSIFWTVCYWGYLPTHLIIWGIKYL